MFLSIKLKNTTTATTTTTTTTTTTSTYDVRSSSKQYNNNNIINNNSIIVKHCYQFFSQISPCMIAIVVRRLLQVDNFHDANTDSTLLSHR